MKKLLLGCGITAAVLVVLIIAISAIMVSRFKSAMPDTDHLKSVRTELVDLYGERDDPLTILRRLGKQLEMSGQLDFLKQPYHKAIMNDDIPLSIGGGIGQSRTNMYLLKKAHLGEVSVTVWPEILKDICKKKNIHVLE